MLRALQNQVENFQELMESVSTEIETLRKNKKQMLEIKKNTLREMKNAFSGLMSKWHMAEEGASKLKDMKIESSKTDKQR